MRTIHKYAIPIEDSFSFSMPIGARILAFQTQNGRPVLWALVDTENDTERRKFVIRGTGNPILSEAVDSDVHIGTIQKDGLVWHLFEVVA